MRIELRPYEPSHAAEIALMIGMERPPDFGRWAQEFKDRGPANSLFIDDRLAASAGIVLLEWNRGEAWLLISPVGFFHVKTVFSQIKRNLLKIVEEKGLKRVQALVRVGFFDGMHFMEHLGFSLETPTGLRAYGPRNEDMFMYARVF